MGRSCLCLDRCSNHLLDSRQLEIEKELSGLATLPAQAPDF